MTLVVDATTAQHASGIGTVILGIINELRDVTLEPTTVISGPDLVAPHGLTIRRVPLVRTRPGRLLYQRCLLPADIALIGRNSGPIDRVLLLDAYVPLIRPQRQLRYAALVHDVLPLTHPEFWPPPKRLV